MPKLKVWLKAFIPYDVEGSEPVPGDNSQTMLHPGLVERCFLTDRRDFSDDLDASARMHSEIAIDLQTRRVLNELHKCYPTTEVDCATGEIKCTESADTSSMKWEKFEVSDTGIITVDLFGSTHNPCMKVVGVPVSPNLDYNGTLTVSLLDGISIAFAGNIETYPAFEMYASIDDGAPQTIFREPIADGANLLSLTGPPTRAISHQIKLK